MELTDIKLRKYFPDGQLAAVYSLTFDNELAVHDVKIVRKDGGLILVMPSRVAQDGTRRDVVHPINAEFRGKLASQVVKFHNDTVKGC